MEIVVRAQADGDAHVHPARQRIGHRPAVENAHPGTGDELRVRFRGVGAVGARQSPVKDAQVVQVLGRRFAV